MKQMMCLRCDTEMNPLGVKKLQCGETGWLLGDLPNLLAGALEVELYSCPQCGRIEMFLPEPQGNEIPLVQCPQCGHRHEFDDPKCPVCKHSYYQNR